MITIYGPDGLVSAVAPGACEGCWIELMEPEPTDIALAASLSGVDGQLILEALDLHERPRIEQDDSTTLLVIRAPHKEDGPGQDRYSTVPLGILLARTNIVTVCKIKDESWRGCWRTAGAGPRASAASAASATSAATWPSCSCTP